MVGFDHRGFGKSEGDPGRIDSLSLHLEDSRLFMDRMCEMYKDLPKFVTGLSMGGMTSFRLSLERPERFKGVILMAPAIQSIHSGFLKKAAKVLGSLMPNVQLLK